MGRFTGVRRATVVATVAALAIGGATAGLASAAPQQSSSAANPVADAFGKLIASGVDANNVSTHLRAFQDIADRNGGNRALGTSGYTRSVEYVESQLRHAGFAPTRQELTTTMFTVDGFHLKAGGAQVPAEILGYSGAAKEFTAPVSQVPAGDTTPGCELSDFPAATKGSIVVVQRGVCPFSDKADNAKKAGARGMVVVNNEDGATTGTLGEEIVAPIPAVAVERGADARVRGAGSLTLAVDAETIRKKTWNVLAETYAGDPNSVVMVGAHLDGVPEGPGVNDNGSGVAGVLQTAKTMTAFAPVRNKVRYAFWGAEEQGLIGSTHYVTTLPDAERAKIKRYLNFDMIGSHNGGYFVYDGDGSSKLEGSYPGPHGSGEIERVLSGFLTAKGLRPEPSGFNGRSDYDAFANAGIASGGVDSGADEKKTPAQARKWGGVAGKIFDPNYHTARDTYANVNQKVLGNLAPAVAYGAGYFAMA